MVTGNLVKIFASVNLAHYLKNQFFYQIIKNTKKKDDFFKKDIMVGSRKKNFFGNILHVLDRIYHFSNLNISVNKYFLSKFNSKHFFYKYLL